MRRWMIGICAAGMGLAAATPTMAQTRPHVSGSESSRRIEATCTVNGDAQACGGTYTGVLMPDSPGPIIVGISPVLIPAVSPARRPVVIPGLGAGSGGHAGTNTDVDRTSHHGREIVR